VTAFAGEHPALQKDYCAYGRPLAAKFDLRQP
jgi:hypothetical protein